MSGSSYDYASREMEDGRLDKALLYLAFALEDLMRVGAAPVRVLETEVTSGGHRVGKLRDATEEERLLTHMGIGALRTRLDAFIANLRAASQGAKEMAELFHELEWLRSGDSAVDNVQAFAREWARKKLEGA